MKPFQPCADTGFLELRRADPRDPMRTRLIRIRRDWPASGDPRDSDPVAGGEETL